MRHVLLGGIHGYLPDRIEECEDFGTALETAAILYELDANQLDELSYWHALALDPNIYGSEYLEIQEADESWNQVYNTH